MPEHAGQRIKSQQKGVATTALSGTPTWTQGPSVGSPPSLAAAPSVAADTTYGGYNIQFTPPTGNSALINIEAVLDAVNIS